MKLLLFTIFYLGLPGVYLAQHDHDHDHEGHDHEHEQVHDHKHEFGIANAPVYFVNEKEVSYGMHLHYVYNFADKMGVGLGYERIFDEHEHHTIGIVASFRPSTNWVFNISPGITYEKSISEEKNFALHLEGTYEFFFGHFHIGPVMEVAYDPEDYHFSIGLHIGIGF